jgi:hypothetical protein
MDSSLSQPPWDKKKNQLETKKIKKNEILKNKTKCNIVKEKTIPLGIAFHYPFEH